MSDEFGPFELNKRLRIILNKELVRGLLLRYFTDKGYDSDNKIYPPMTWDLPNRVPEMANKIEVVPYIIDINPMTGVVNIGWNLFVLGNKRMDLGHSTHRNMADLERSVRGQATGDADHGSLYSPREIAEFVSELLSLSKDGGVDLLPPGTQPPSASLGSDGTMAGVNRPRLGPTASGGFYERNRPVN